MEWVKIGIISNLWSLIAIQIEGYIFVSEER